MRTRTSDPMIKSHLLYQLSYERTKLYANICPRIKKNQPEK